MNGEPLVVYQRIDSYHKLYTTNDKIGQAEFKICPFLKLVQLIVI